MTQIPLFQPPSEWLPPETIPDLHDADQIAIDLETYTQESRTSDLVGLQDMERL